VAPDFVFVPLSRSRFATLARHLRNEGTAVFSLMRNIGSSVGHLGVVALLTRNTQILHARLAEHVTPFGDGLAASAAAVAPDATRWLAGVNAAVTRQAAMLAYTTDFYLMLVLSLCAVPLVFPVAARAARSLLQAGGGGMNRAAGGPSPHLVASLLLPAALPGRTSIARATGHPGLSHRTLASVAGW